ncbi:MAG: hypothetical protein PHF00_05675, partial [Elusimicrobia bacterium]|nr:hypothetical protein [Elusimicrobiota bacterium]
MRDKVVAVLLSLSVLAAAPGTASYAAAAEVFARPAKGGAAGPAVLPALKAGLASALAPSLAAPASLNGALSGLHSGAPGLDDRPPAPSAGAEVRAAAVPRPVEAAPAADPQAPLEQLKAAADPAGRESGISGPGPGAGAAFDGSRSDADAPELNRYIHENYLGWRNVRGARYDPGLKPLPAAAGADRVIEQLARQFGFSRAELVDLAKKYRLTPEDPVSDWLAVYDRMQDYNRRQFKILDRKKYEGFRRLANKTYAEGWSGTLQRAAELHKHILGFFLRLPYHLFDSFVFGYFRQNISFAFWHSAENFLDLKDPDHKKSPKDVEDGKRPTLKWLEEVLHQHAFRNLGAWARLRTTPWVRLTDRFLIQPVLAPLLQFVSRRLALAAMSAVAMGLLGAFAPALPLSFALAAIPILGPFLLIVAQGVPAGLGFIPVVGPILAPVVAAAANALLKDLVLGPLLNTLILSSLMTLPASYREQAFELRKLDPTSPLSVADRVRALGRALASASFWRQNLRSFVSMASVGAEIEGIMAYAGSLDGLLSPGCEALTGRKFAVFQSIGAAVERPQGESPIPFGGAITWGNVLLYKAQEALGLNISDMTMRAVLGLKGAAHDTAENAALADLSAQQAVASASHRPDSSGYQVDPELYQQGPEAVLARIKELAAQPGALGREIAAVQDHMARLEAELRDTEGRAAQLRGQSRPISEVERAEYERLLAELQGKREEDYVQSKLAQLHDLKNPRSEDLERLRELKRLQDHYEAVLLPPPPGPDGMLEDLSFKDASLKALSEHMAQLAGRGPPAEGARGGPPVDAAVAQSISKLAQEIEDLRGQVRAEMANRDAASGLLAVANKSRNMALRDRRDGKEMLEFHQNLSRLATVMDLALSLNEIAAAQAAIKQMMDLLDKKLDKINRSRAGNQQGQQQAAGNNLDVEKWREELRQTIKDDDATKARVVENQGKATLASARFQAFRNDMSGLIGHIKAEDGGSGGDPLREYQRRLDLLPQAVKWRTDGGNPNDPDAFSLKQFQDDLALVEDYVKRAQDGISQLQTMPVEYAGVAIIAVPGPEVNVKNPTKEQVLQILAERQAYWRDKRADYQKSLDTVTRRMDPNNGRAVLDEFGDAAPESLPRWRAQQADELARSKTKAQQYLAQLDALAGHINAVTGSNIPMLSSLPVDELRAQLPAYGDKLRAVKFPPSENNPDVFVAQMDLVSVAKILPYAAHEVVHWARADATMTEIDKALATTLPEARDKIGAVVRMLDDVLADVDADRDYMNRGGSPQALIDRKLALVQVKILPVLRDAKALLENTLIPWQRSSIDTAQPRSGKLFELFDCQKTLWTEIQELYDKTVPWAMAPYGAAEGNKAEGHALIADFRKKLTDNRDGYEDAKGHNKGVKEYQAEVQNRKDPNYAGTEVMYGETQPYSLPRKISQYTAERAQRAAEINAQSGQINEILGKIEALSHGKYSFQSYRLPANVTADDAGVARVQGLVDNGTLRGLGNRLTAVGNEASAAAGSIGLGLGGGNTVPVGTQPPISLSEQQQIALLCLEAAKRLVPSSATAPESAACYYAVARFLFSDGIIDAAQDGLQNQVPVAEAFLAKLAKVLSGAIDDTARDDAYVDSGGTSESQEALYARKNATFGGLAAILQEAAAFFDVKQTWNQASFATIDKVASYYNSLGDVYDAGLQVNDSEVTALQKMREALKKTYDELEANRRKVTAWMTQLNDPHESALRRVSDSISELQVKTRAVLEANVEYHKLKDQVDRSQTILSSLLVRADAKQKELQAELAKPAAQGSLPPELVERVAALRPGAGGAWALPGADPRQTQALVVRKAEFGSFLDAVLGAFQGRNSGLDLSSLKGELLKDPRGLAGLIPGAAVLDFGDTADGFYLVYQTRFAVPNGLETGNWITLGNVAQLWGNNISVSGYQFASPPNDYNAPYGDKGVEVQVESLQGRKWVNYLNVALHRFALDVPADMKMETQAKATRVMIFDDFAMMLLGDRLYVGLAGFADFAANKPAQQPIYYGGNFTASLKLTEVMRLNAKQQALFASDPRKFMQEVNLDFTGYDPDLNRTFQISAEGEKKNYFRTEVGPSFDLARLLRSQDAFTLDLFFANTSGTDDIAQRSIGATVLKGFTIRGSDGKPKAQITNRLTGELGESYNSVTDRLSVTLPDYGVVVSGEGKILGSAKTYYGEVAKQIGGRTTFAVGYGSRYVGMNNRLSLSANTSFTLGELWQTVIGKAASELKGGETLKVFDKKLDDFFAESSRPAEGGRAAPTVAALKAVFQRDVARQLVSQEIGRLTRDIQDLRKAGAFLDNTRMRGMVGFVTNPISNDETDRAVGGGFVAGTFTELSLTKSQKALVAAKAESLYREGLRLQTRFVDLVKGWQEAVIAMARAQWELKMAEFSVQNAPSEAARREAAVRRTRAAAALHEALVRYNALAGRPADAEPPFANLDAADLESLLYEIRMTVAAPERLAEVLHSLDRSELAARLGPEPFNLVDWLPWVERLS